MKRKALLVCNNDASGATHDIDKWEHFLISGNGGAWEKREIEKVVNPTLQELRNSIRGISSQCFDFVFVAFAGHGAWTRSTVLEINPDGETIDETEFNNLSKREVVCFDCCRGVSSSFKGIVDEALERSFSEGQREWLRKTYDARMMQAQPQLVKLYACQIGQSAYGDSDGGIYTNNLIGAATDFLPSSSFQTVNRAHCLAAPLTKTEILERFGQTQEPDMAEARCCISQQLIIGINTRLFMQL